jgi:serine/threonine protein kinase
MNRFRFGGAMGGDLMAREWDVPGYTEVKTLASGGFGDVVLAWHDASGTAVVIKYLRRRLLADPEFTAALLAEAAVLASLDDPNVTRLVRVRRIADRCRDRDGTRRRVPLRDILDSRARRRRRRH